MSKQFSETSTSRFAHHGDEPEIGGVRSTSPAKRPAANGVPGPEERLLDISEIIRHVGMRYTHQFRIPPTEDGSEEGITLAGPMEGQITLTNTGAALLLEGEVTTALSLECSRCLSPTVDTVSGELDEQFDLITTSNAFHQDIVTAVDEDAPASMIEGGNILNLGELLRQSLVLAAPGQPLCREDCPGINIAGHEGIEYTLEGEEAEGTTHAEVHADNPLRHLAEMLEAKRRQEENA